MDNTELALKLFCCVVCKGNLMSERQDLAAVNSLTFINNEAKPKVIRNMHNETDIYHHRRLWIFNCGNCGGHILYL